MTTQIPMPSLGKVILPIVMLLISLNACGVHNMDPELQSYADSFQQDAINETGLNSMPVPMQFTDTLPEEVLGRCKHRMGNDHVLINKARWERLSEMRRLAVVYHEQAHCVFNTKHSDRPHQIMSSQITSNPVEEKFNTFWKYVKEEMK